MVQAKTKEKPQDVVDPETGLVTEKTNDSKALVVQDEYAGYEEDAGAGFENQTQEDYVIPRIRILGSQSPEVLAHQDEENSAFRPGMLYNATRQLLVKGREGFDFVPVCTEHKFVEFIPRTKGGGFVDQYTLDDPLIVKCRREQEFGEYSNPANGNDITEIFELFMLELDANGDPAPASFGFKSTAIRPYRDFMTRARGLVVTLPDGRKITKLPLFSHCYNFKTEKKTGGENVWHIPDISFAGGTAPDSRVSPSSTLYAAARELRDSVAAGRLRADTSALRTEGEGDPAPARARGAEADAEPAPY
jgi:hypothetical protein